LGKTATATNSESTQNLDHSQPNELHIAKPQMIHGEIKTETSQETVN